MVVVWFCVLVWFGRLLFGVMVVKFVRCFGVSCCCCCVIFGCRFGVSLFCVMFWVVLSSGWVCLFVFILKLLSCLYGFVGKVIVKLLIGCCRCCLVRWFSLCIRFSGCC